MRSTFWDGAKSSNGDLTTRRNGKEKIARRLKEINELIEEKEAEVQEHGLKLEQIRAKLSEIAFCRNRSMFRRAREIRKFRDLRSKTGTLAENPAEMS